jgi:hypothetical protein
MAGLEMDSLNWRIQLIRKLQRLRSAGEITPRAFEVYQAYSFDECTCGEIASWYRMTMADVQRDVGTVELALKGCRRTLRKYDEADQWQVPGPVRP